MKNIQTGSNEHHNCLNPHLVSDTRDMTTLSSEARLRAVANTMTSHLGHQAIEVTQGSIAATIHALHEFLTQLISSIAINFPHSAAIHLVSTSGIDLLSLSEHEIASHCPVPTFPVAGYINRGKHNGAPKFGEPVFEPTICMTVNHSGDMAGDMFRVCVILPPDDLQVLMQMQVDCGESWEEFGSRFGIKPLKDSPLTLNIWFNQDGPLHKPLVAAISVLECLTLYKQFCIDNDEKENVLGLINHHLKRSIEIDNECMFWRSESKH